MLGLETVRLAEFAGLFAHASNLGIQEAHVSVGVGEYKPGLGWVDGAAPSPLSDRRCHIAVRRAGEVHALRIFKPLRGPDAKWSSPRRVARGVI